MQSQQKKVKWSRGETADALEERTDTGITQVSVSKMENIVADIYGNISRRPAFKIIDSENGASEIPVVCNDRIINDNTFLGAPESFVFTIDANTYIVFIKKYNTFGGLLIQNNKFVRKIDITYQPGLTTTLAQRGKISVSQYNNFMVVANCFFPDVVFRMTGSNINNYAIYVEKFLFSAPWVAPNGTKTRQISSADIAGLNFIANTIGEYTFTEANGETTVYSWIDTSISSGQFTGTWEGQTTTYYYHFGNNITPWFDTNPTGSEFVTQITMTNGTTYTNGDTIGTGILGMPLVINIGTFNSYLSDNMGAVFDVTSNVAISSTTLGQYIPIGSIVQFPNNAAYMRVEGFAPDNNGHLRMFGSLLTPVANDNATDNVIKVETGYMSLQAYMPTKFTFSQQRLYASGFIALLPTVSPQQIPGYAVGSQIARYNDFKNNYNTQNEPISIDISTSYQEQIVAMLDYNGLKILTDAAEYAMVDGAAVKQSENGSLATCKPIVFGPVCLYADKSGGQIRALQYELQTNIFNSSSINQMTQEDLIFNTDSMGGFIDKEHYTGHFLFAAQTGHDIITETMRAMHSFAVCNFVPGNQTQIWSRWTTPSILSKYTQKDRHSVQNIIEINNKIWFVVGCEVHKQNLVYEGYTLAELDYDAVMDFETDEQPIDTEYYLIKPIRNFDLYAWEDASNNVYYTRTLNVLQGDTVYRIYGTTLIEEGIASNSPAGPNIMIGTTGYYEWEIPDTSTVIYTKDMIPNPTGERTDPSRQLFDASGNLIANRVLMGVEYEPYGKPRIRVSTPVPDISGVYPVWNYDRTFDTLSFNTTTATYNGLRNEYKTFATIPGTVSVFDDDEYKWDDTLTQNGEFTQSIEELEHPRVGFMINATLESHPIDIQGKTYTEKKRIGKCVAVIRNTEPGAFTVCDKTGYTAPDKKTVNFYGCTGMKDQVRYTIKNIKGAKFTIESLTMIVEYGTLDS